jgi:DNA polymerase III subunit beta
MRFTVDRVVFQRAWTLAAAAAASKKVNPALHAVRVDAADNRLLLQATDNETAVAVSCVAQVSRPGRGLLPLDGLGPILRTLRKNQNEFTIERDGDGPLLGCDVPSDNSELVVRLLGASFRLPDGGPDTVATVPTVDGTKPVLTIEAVHFGKAIRQTAAAIKAAEDGRFALQSICLEPGDGETRFTGTDGRRLHTVVCPSTASEGWKPKQLLIPARVASVLKATVADAGDAVIELQPFDRGLLIRAADGASIQTRLAEGRYPRWQDVLPKGPPEITFSANLSDLRNQVEQAAICTTAESSKVVVEIGKRWGIAAWSNAPEAGKARVEYPGEPAWKKAGQGFLALDPTYLTAVLDACELEAEHVLVRYFDKQSPLLLEAGAFQGVVMPLSADDLDEKQLMKIRPAALAEATA